MEGILEGFWGHSLVDQQKNGLTVYSTQLCLLMVMVRLLLIQINRTYLGLIGTIPVMSFLEKRSVLEGLITENASGRASRK